MFVKSMVIQGKKPGDGPGDVNDGRAERPLNARTGQPQNPTDPGA
jgi:hypothetical protein